MVALSNGTVRRYDQQTRRLRKATKGQCARRGGLYALATGDLNSDGFDETIAYCSDQSLFVYGTNYPRWRGDVFAAGTFGLTVGQLDDDPALEIVTDNGHVIDAVTHDVEWFLEGGFGSLVRAADIDGDGRDEIVAADFAGTVAAFDVDLQLQKWSFSSTMEVEAMADGRHR